MLPVLFSVNSSLVTEPPQFVCIQELVESLARIQFGPVAAVAIWMAQLRVKVATMP